jgi:hypothetical protein
LTKYVKLGNIVLQLFIGTERNIRGMKKAGKVTLSRRKNHETIKKVFKKI